MARFVNSGARARAEHEPFVQWGGELGEAFLSGVADGLGDAMDQLPSLTTPLSEVVVSLLRSEGLTAIQSQAEQLAAAEAVREAAAEERRRAREDVPRCSVGGCGLARKEGNLCGRHAAAARRAALSPEQRRRRRKGEGDETRPIAPVAPIVRRRAAAAAEAASAEPVVVTAPASAPAVDSDLMEDVARFFGRKV